MRFLGLTFAIAVLGLNASACSYGTAVIESFERSPADVASGCRDVCSRRLGIDDWSFYRVDDCADTFSTSGGAGVACVRQAEGVLFAPGRRLAVVLAPTTNMHCRDVCAAAIRAHDSDVLVACRDTETKEGDPAAVCAIEWASPSRGL